METAFIIAWAVGSAGVFMVVLAARHRRAELARELHELRGALTGARLAVDLIPILGINKDSVCQAASEELERSYHALGEFEELLHEKVMPVRKFVGKQGKSSGGLLGRRSRFDVLDELERLEPLWMEVAKREQRSFLLDWRGPIDGVYCLGSKRRFIEVISNLLGNAFRHGAGHVTLLARVRSDSIRIEIRDQGPGLARPVASLARRRRSGRHGHGLPVAMRAAAKLGAEISSAPSSEGAVLVFNLPTVHDPSFAAAVRKSTDEQGGQAAARSVFEGREWE